MANNFSRTDTTSQEVLDKILALYDAGKLNSVSIKEAVGETQLCKLVYKGAQFMSAHREYRKRVQSEARTGRELLKLAQADPELAERFGLGTRA